MDSTFDEPIVDTEKIENPVPPEPLTQAEERSRFAHDAAKRNCGRTGPKTPEGKAISSRNALRHGCCAKTLILDDEKLEDWIELCACWEATYPSDHPMLQNFILRTAQADWERIRVQNSFSERYTMLDIMAIESISEDTRKDYALRHRYKTAAERSFQREYRMLDHFYKTHCEPKKSASAAPPPPPKDEPKKEAEPEDDKPIHDPNTHVYRIYNAVTGEYSIAGEEPRVIYPPEPGWVPRKIIPGYFYPDHPSHWKYPGDPKHRFTKDKKKWSKQ